MSLVSLPIWVDNGVVMFEVLGANWVQLWVWRTHPGSDYTVS